MKLKVLKTLKESWVRLHKGTSPTTEQSPYKPIIALISNEVSTGQRNTSWRLSMGDKKSRVFLGR